VIISQGIAIGTYQNSTTAATSIQTEDSDGGCRSAAHGVDTLLLSRQDLGGNLRSVSAWQATTAQTNR
jgi:hypothetical protein